MIDARIQIYQLNTNPLCGIYRLDFPRDAMNRRDVCQVNSFTSLSQHNFDILLSQADLIVVQRLPISHASMAACLKLKDHGKKIIFELDDDLLHLDPRSRFGQLAPPDYGNQIRQSAMASHAVQCSTAALAYAVAPYNPRVAVLENQLAELPPFTMKSGTGPVIVGYAAGEDHYLDWLTIQDSFNACLRRLEQHNFALEVWIIGDEKIFNSIQSAAKRFFPLLTRADYLETVSRFHLSLIPLADSQFNRCKSDVKFLESAAAGTPVLASHVVYGATIQDGETGEIFRSPEEFAEKLERLIRDQDMRARLAKAAYDYVSSNRMIDQHISRWENFYQRCI